MSTNFSIKRQIFVFFYWDWLCLLEGNKIHCGGRRDHKNSLCSEEKISLEFYSLQTFRVVLMVGILQSNWWNELLKIFFIPFLLAFHHTSSPQEVGTCPQATYPPPTDRYEPPGYTPSPNRPVRAPGLALLQQTGTSSLGVPPSPNRPVRAPRLHTLSQQIDTCPQASPVPHRPERAA
jgi:hypothetical protein